MEEFNGWYQATAKPKAVSTRIVVNLTVLAAARRSKKALMRVRPLRCFTSMPRGYDGELTGYRNVLPGFSRWPTVSATTRPGFHQDFVGRFARGNFPRQGSFFSLTTPRVGGADRWVAMNANHDSSCARHSPTRWRDAPIFTILTSTDYDWKKSDSRGMTFWFSTDRVSVETATRPPARIMFSQQPAARRGRSVRWDRWPPSASQK
jgi:hypothetical protein